ncbi:hypothetical protein [Methylocaldum szegediense]|jgi:hypothetical protein|uniref:Uncharacterized protein n=1 Tax=Methylocaldum szegediense TaxID=73780 RepID=A0ABM9HWJ0_9GAMM|nr:hypothetical protein [Methylocaldum szegediense]CAI8732989.1 protein of unknown function [Methylocaldum szegediense]
MSDFSSLPQTFTDVVNGMDILSSGGVKKKTVLRKPDIIEYFSGLN